MKKRILALLLIMTMIIPSLMMPVAAAPQKANGYIEAADTYGAVAKAVVTKLNGNQNGLTITVSVDGVVVAYRYVLINNNSAGEFVVGDYKVYVSTYGNDKIDYCFITYAPEPPCGHDWVTVFTATCLYGGISKEVCGLCGGEQNEEIVSALGHDFSEEVETVPPTSQKEGYTVYKCVRCDETKTFVLPGVMRDITGTEFVNEMGLGWNLGNALDSAGYPYGSERNLLGLDEMSWGSPMITKSMIDAVAEAGFKTLRIPITWETKIGPAPDYKITDVWMNRVEEIVNYGLANDMTVIINIHHDGWISLSNNSGAAKTAANAQFTAVWTQIADRFKNYGDKLVFESLNEPREYGANNEWTGGSTQGRNYLNELNQLMVNTVRGTGGNNEKRFIMVPT
ncbi:MAG: glycoside hydrolase family 5 protein, partial [Oscillospiraceae bacterium]|nr:glycoside hydrolase family 5 protein [Oscillospiraceae bacterium]